LNFEHQVLKEYGVALRAADLHHLVLSERAAIEAAQFAAAYLRLKTKPMRHVFSCRSEDATFSMAALHVSRSPAMQLLWTAESAAAAARQDAHWNAVREKQELLKKLDAQLADYRANLKAAELNRKSTSTIVHSQWHEYDQQVRQYQRLCATTESEVRETEKPPTPIFQPLPKDEALARPILFFLQLPAHFQVLSRLSFAAQQMLLPESEVVVPSTQEKIVVADAIKDDTAKTTWRSYYLNGSSARHLSEVVETKVLLGSNYTVPQASQFSPANVRHFSSPSDGVWYPDALAPRLMWTGGQFDLDTRDGGYFNPFATLPDDALVVKFTETLHCDRCAMQWAMVQNGTRAQPSRGNIPEARQDSKPSWLSGKTEFFSYGTLRAYPHQQIRKLCVALRERSMPLEDPAVRKLLQQTFFHLGELSISTDVPHPVWRTDVDKFGGWEALRLELADLADELKLKPRQHAAVLILGELAAHASQWDAASRDVARSFANIALGWAREDIETASAQKVAHLRARRCIFAMYAISSHGAGELLDEDVAALCKALIVADYSRLFEDPSPLDEMVHELTIVSHAVLARRLPALLTALDRNSSPLTEAVRVVLETLTPATLNWQRVTYNSTKTTCFEAVSNGHLFSVNLQVGTVLYDGLPPSRLPKTILDMPLYQRTFTDPCTGQLHNCEVVLSSDGILQTVRLQGGFMYKFFLNAVLRKGVLRKELVVREVDPANSDSQTNELELLDGTEEGVAIWGRELPVRLQRMHSHWLCRATETVIVRGTSFSRRDAQFIMLACTTLPALKASGTVIPNFAGSGGWLCCRVPDHQAKIGWVQLCKLLPGFDQLVLPQASRALHVLSKFETLSGLTHAYYTSPDGVLRLELPRYDLSFDMQGDGRLRSNNFLGFALGLQQQLRDALFDFSQYLILESARQTLLIMPVGEVKRDPNQIYIHGSDGRDVLRRLHVYELHPRFSTIEAKAGATAIEARLQLATVYAATGTELPEARSKRTGGEVAMELVRQSWKGSPLTLDEVTQLKSILLYGQLTPALPLLCFETHMCASELLFLRPDMKKEAVAIRYDADSATEYAQRKQRAQLNAHALLTRDEEQTLLGRKISARSVGNMPSAGTLDLPAHESKARVIASIEQLLRRMLVSTVAMDRQDFPLTASDVEDNELGRTIFAELSDSWSAHQRMPMFELAREIVQLEKELLVQHGLAKVAREQVEHYLLAHADHVPMNAGWHALGFLMRRAANLEPRVSLRDFARAAWEPTHLRLFNPFLSDAAVDEVLHPAVLEWLQLCVLEDKLQRMALIAEDCNAPELERELREVGREWSVTQHPQWLVFEVEQQLQIRRMQYCVAKYCIDTPGAITQLNMGEGKTRVILPMLVLHLAQPNRLVRLHFLSQLIGEAYFYLHRHLTASIMCRRLLHLPFHRGVKLTVQDVQVVRDCLVRCMRAHGAIFISPEHRLSLQLKWHELRLSQVNADLVQALPSLDDLPYCDLLDESDEILHHKYQLIYACGANVQLPDGNVRWTAVQTMLHLLQASPEVATLLAKPNVAKRLPMGAQKGAGAFDDLRLLPGSELDNVRMPLRRELAWALLRGPPYHMRWLRDTSVTRASDDIIKFLTDPNDALGRFMAMLTASSCPINGSQRAQLLALRGLLASGLLEHCLSRRHRVDYGVDPRRGINRRVAVPYRASDTPSDRAEYAQPDTLIILTHLSYYHSGLSRDELKEAVAALLKLGPIAQERHYGQWLESARSSMSASQLSALDHVNKLDVSSDVQLDIMHKVYHSNMSTVNFWLDTCVLPRETMQFPKRLVANAFNLTDNPRRDVIGFSGTKENHLLLPFHVMQGLPKGADELLATDGKMCDLVLQNKEVSILPTTCALSAAVLRLAVVERGADALIDAGATMAGLSNEEVATKVIELLPQSSRLQGAIYFSSQLATWLVRSRHGRTWPQSSSPIHEKDCFVYFDESRCRGADMKLHQSGSGPDDWSQDGQIQAHASSRPHAQARPRPAASLRSAARAGAQNHGAQWRSYRPVVLTPAQVGPVQHGECHCRRAARVFDSGEPFLHDERQPGGALARREPRAGRPVRQRLWRGEGGRRGKAHD